MTSYKFDESKLEMLESLVEVGMPAYRAVPLAFGVDQRTYFRWVASGESPSSNVVKCHIKHTLERGRARCNLRLVSIINRQIQRGDGRLAWKFLQYIHPEAYA
jgi:hypothetical protein